MILQNLLAPKNNQRKRNNNKTPFVLASSEKPRWNMSNFFQSNRLYKEYQKNLDIYIDDFG